MKSKMNCLEVLVVIALVAITVSGYPNPRETVPEDEFLVEVHDNKKYKVDFFVLATEWPQGTCEWNNATHHHKCVVPGRNWMFSRTLHVVVSKLDADLLGRVKFSE